MKPVNAHKLRKLFVSLLDSGLYRIIWGLLLVFMLSNHYSGVCAERESFVSSGDRFNIAIFREEGFPSIGTPGSLTPEWLYDFLSGRFAVTYLDLSELSDGKYLNPDNFELLILPYGEAIPRKAFPSIKEYLLEGGGLLHIAGRPFWVAVEKVDGKWQELDTEDPYEEFLSPLGIKYYEYSDNEHIGLSVTTSCLYTPVTPTHGNVFPYRIPARDFYSLETIKGDGAGQTPVLIKSWRTPYLESSNNIPGKWCLIGSRGENHPLNPQNPLARDTLINIMEYLSFPVIIYELETDRAAYHQKERVRVSVKVANYGSTRNGCAVDFEFQDKTGKTVHKKRRTVDLGAGERTTLEEIWYPGEFGSDFYKITVILENDGKILDKEENGIVVINEDVLKSGPSVQIEGDRFLINAKPSFILGANYYDSKLGELMWLKPNLLKIREDFKAMRSSGINFVRIHYHHSKWFRDYFLQVAGESVDPYLEVADTTPLPRERSLRILDAIIQLAQEQGLIFCMDIFSLVPEEMGDPVGWLGLKGRIIDKDKVDFQKKFAGLLGRRYKDVPGITWDLWNEPRLEKPDYGLLRDWADQIKKVFRENGDNHLITIGGDISIYLLDVLDYACIHTYEPAEFVYLDNLSKPFIFQEVWNDAGCSLNEEMRQAQELKKDFAAFLETKAAGFVPWQWTRQARLWNIASEAERWDDELGVCVHDDGTLKPAGKVYSSLIGLMGKDEDILE